MSNCYNTASISSSPWYAGGITGMNSGVTITNCYNIGTITSTWNLTGAISGNGSSSNCYYLAGITANANGAEVKSESNMKDAVFITLLNGSEIPAVWMTDYTPNVNNGFPILYYQPSGGDQPTGAIITIAEIEHGAIVVFKDGVQINNGDMVEPGSRLKLVANPDNDYVLNKFTADNIPMIGYDYDVYTNVEFSAKFEYSKNVQRWDGTIAETYGGGSGSRRDPYLIFTPQQLTLVSKNSAEGMFDMSTYFKLMNNLDLAMLDWTPIGVDQSNSFKAYFNGNYKTIAGLYIKNKP